MSIVWNVLAYKSIMMQVEDDALNFYPKRQSINYYPEEGNNWGGDSSIVLLDDGHLGDTVIPDSIDLSSNNIPEIRYSVLSYLHIYGEKYRI